MKNRKTSHIFVKPQNYYNHLLTFFFIISFVLTLTLSIRLGFSGLEIFLLQFFVILFLLLSIGVLIEFYNLGEYMNPLETYEIQHFIYSFLDTYHHKKSVEDYFNKYDAKTRKNLIKLLDRDRVYSLSSIRKYKRTYQVTLLDERKVFRYFLIHFFLGKIIYRVHIQKHNDSWKIIRVE